jgi:hypothetical protein
MSFCPFNQDKECSSKCAIFDVHSLACSFYGCSMLLKKIDEKLNDVAEEIIKCGEGR